MVGSGMRTVMYPEDKGHKDTFGSRKAVICVETVVRDRSSSFGCHAGAVLGE